MKIILCEDDPQQRKKMQLLIMKYIMSTKKDVELILSASKPEEVLNYTSFQKADCYLLDIELNSDISGLELAKKIRNEDPLANIIFITTFAEKLKLTFTYKIVALDFIVKNEENLEGKIIEALNSAYDKYHQINFKENTKSYTLKIGGLIKKIKYENIYYFETSTQPHRVVLSEVNGVYTFYGNLKEIESELLSETSQFFRCHRSFIINIDYIEYFDSINGIIKMKNGHICNVSPMKRKKIKKLLNN
ncbi:LytR/AlgR family response regulator transcription factor [Kurthia huakuii]|uniref:LytR/AlgR family response regulator transcription factor n=1 Tax=Kurthia huakuii TaxID=1421019 RepID=UPI000497DF7F|nr:LytTR family DNA-binding domain-containing protein [Kurthia huakuii]MBM7699771.1 two-component system response regulator AgrA [Kurthia huakuii]